MTDTITKIKEIEKKAEELVKKAHDEAFHNIKVANKQNEEELAKAKESSLAEKKSLVAKAQQEAEAEVKVLEKESQKEIVKLKTQTAAKIKPAKEEILRCLS